VCGGANARRRQDAGTDDTAGNGLGHFSSADETESVGIGRNGSDFHFGLRGREISLDLKLNWGNRERREVKQSHSHRLVWFGHLHIQLGIILNKVPTTILFICQYLFKYNKYQQISFLIVFFSGDRKMDCQCHFSA